MIHLVQKQRTEKKLEVGARIRHLRKKLNLSMDDLAAQIESTSATISNIENGLSMPGGELLVKLAQTLHVSVDWLLLGHMPVNINGEVREDRTELIFFNEKWHFFCRFHANYQTSEEQNKLDALKTLLSLAAESSKDELDLLLSLAERVHQKPKDE